MKVKEILVAENGYIVHDDEGKYYIAPTLRDIALIADERSAISNNTVYAPGYDVSVVRKARQSFVDGNKIEAIKLLRFSFDPPLGLREAKDLVEQLCA